MRRIRGLWRGLLAALLGGLACASPILEGEERYREGDRLGALEIWRSVPPDSNDWQTAQRHVESLEAEFEQLMVRYRQRGRYFERAGRLAESILNYRLALKLQPDDRETLQRVQQLARRLAERKVELQGSLQAALAQRDVAAAARHLADLRELDPFDPALESEERRLDASVQVEVEEQVAEGRRRFQGGDLTGASAAFERALALEPGNETARGYQSYLETVRRELNRSGSPPGGLRAPDAFASEAQIRAEGLHQNALAADRAGDPWSAIRYELQALRVDTKHVGARRHLTELRARLGPYVEELIESGRASFRQEDLQSALDHWRRALLVEPDNERAREYVARAERMLENLERLRSEPTPSRRRR